MWRVRIVMLSLVALAAACVVATATASGRADGVRPRPPAPATVAGPVPTAAAVAGPTPSPAFTSTPMPDGGIRPTPVFVATVSEIDDALRARMVYSWHAGCPVPLEDLRYLSMTYWGFDGRPHRGEMVVHRDLASGVVRAFHSMFDARFPLERMRLVDDYQGDDERSMEANNTSAFNCRAMTGNPDVWSEHSYGRAVDVDPVQNPYVTTSGTVLPPQGKPYADRSQDAPGMISAGGPVVEAFAAIGWSWGGDWSGTKDYQHFSSTGR
jgi:D-alanyl-D-alanine carboxypeptidase